MEIKKRHIRWYRFLYTFVGPLLRLFTGYRRQLAPSISGPAIIISNHTTDLDPAFVAMSFPNHMVFVASEHTTRWGIFSWLIRHIFAPIIRQKGTTDAKVGRQILRALKNKHNVCVFAEGNRTFNGLTGPFSASTGKLAIASRAHLITYKITGGYFWTPRWGRGTRRGPIRGNVVNTYTPQQLHAMGADAVNAAIARDIFEDAYATQQKAPASYRSARRAEHLETALYLCPQCGGIGTLRSQKAAFFCACGLHGEYDEQGYLRGDGLGFTTVRDWDHWQMAETQRLAAKATGELCTDDKFTLYKVRAQKGADRIAQGRLSLGTAGLQIKNYLFAPEDIRELSIVGRQRLVFAAGGQNYELQCSAPCSALKYQRFFSFLKKRCLAQQSQPPSANNGNDPL